MRARSTAMAHLRHVWWRAPDHFEWFSQYLNIRKASRLTAVVIGTCMLAAVGLELLIMYCRSAPQGTPRMVGWITMASGLLMSSIWLRRRWPSRTESKVFIGVAAISIAVVCLIEPDPMSGLVCCTFFSLLAGYIAFFHSARLMVFSIAVGVATAAVVAVRLAATDPTLAIAKFLVVASVITVIPTMCQVVMQLLEPDVAESETDPLTGLLNRRGFQRRAEELLDGNHRRRDEHLLLLMIDLDRFKVLNDTEGHAAGDQVLIDVSRALRDNTRRDAVIARVGGEEFLIADITTSPDATGVAARANTAIAAVRDAITASIGSVTLPLNGAGSIDGRELFEDLIRIADQAMYEAKRAGGNRSRQVLAEVVDAEVVGTPPTRG